MAEVLARTLGLPALDVTRGGADWPAVEAALGVTLPNDYRRFVGAHGAGRIDNHITVCVPGGPHDRTDLVRHNVWAQECVRLDFAGLDNDLDGWHLGDASQWEPGRADVPPWFEPGDNLVSWGFTGNGDFLFWHVKPGVAADDWPVVFKEEGPYWEQYGVSFSAALVGLLTGEIRSRYLSRWLAGPHSYQR
ncbi:SMI1/KNR4 family protein [Micromonospora sp. NPDC047074]|uniref:SMI1/KNR4 family protein n=1 Tax=Micromonospora sp. NPDC047074 TaxID=3154339 RepID=UPI0033CBB37C